MGRCWWTAVTSAIWTGFRSCWNWEQTQSLEIVTARLVPILLAAGADPNQADSRNETPLRLACKLGLTEAATQLLDAGADIEGASKKTPLMEAALSSRQAVVELLLKRGADVNGNADDRSSALMLAAYGNDDRQDAIEPIVRMLLNAGADVNAVRSKGLSALHKAVKKERATAIAVLLEHGADPFVVDESGKDMLGHAGGAPKEIRRMIERAIEA